MPELVTVSPSEVITSDHTNDLRDRTAQRYDDLTTRGAENPSPTAGDLAFMQDTGDLDVYFSGAWRHLGLPVGAIIDHGGGSTPPGFLVCNGSAVSRTTYAALFSQIGTAWGSGDGSTTFNVPDLRGRVTRGVATSGDGDAVGETFGSDTHTHTGPSHSHSNPTTSSTAHAHTVGTHSHAIINNTGQVNAGGFVVGQEGGATTFEYAIKTHTHSMSFNSGDGTPSVTGGSHSHTQGNTGASGTGNTGSSSTIQASAAVVKLIKT